MLLYLSNVLKRPSDRPVVAPRSPTKEVPLVMNQPSGVGSSEPREMQIGLFLTNQHRPGSDLVTALQDQLRLVRLVRDLGWDSIWGGQHYLPEGMAMPQAVPFMSRLAADAGDMRVGIGILLLALHNPLDVAETWASLDIITEGRLIFGVGLGYREVEYRAFGVDPTQKVTRFEENIRLVDRLWRETGVSSELPWCQLDSVTLNVRPVQQPRPPLWIAANADAAVKRAALMGDAWIINPHATTETIAGQLELFTTTRAQAGLPPVTEQPAIREIFCAPTRELALERCGPYLARKYQHYADWGQDKALPGEESFRIPFEELEQGRFIIGSPDECLEQLLPWRDQLGVNHMILRTDWIGMPYDIAKTSIDLLDREVLPVLRQY
jgi:alkanesulfonate monooxygenase SsuD/methylene tetrahydromethanopterin reductase-like flavin-dependent oxidoreductase (luciferase family)